MKRTKLPATTIEVRAPSAHALSFAPVDTIADPARREALDAADGADLVLRRWTRIARWAVLVLAVLAGARGLLGCSPADWAAAQAAGSTIGAAVDTFALVRAEQIRSKGKEAEAAAASGDTMGALRALSEAQALTTARTFEELLEVRRELAAARAQCPVAGPKP